MTEVMENEKMVWVTIYLDSTGWVEWDDIVDNLIEVEFPERLVRQWYIDNKEKFDEETRHDLGDDCKVGFETWLRSVYIADDTDGLFEYAIEHGFIPEKPDNFAEYVVENDDDDDYITTEIYEEE